MTDTRYQYQPWYIKLWRRRYYLPVPFKVLKSKLRHPNESWTALWSIHIGLAQCAMQWTYKLEDLKLHNDYEKWADAVDAAAEKSLVDAGQRVVRDGPRTYVTRDKSK